MSADSSLSIIAVCSVFLLRTTLAFGICAACSRLVDSAKLRFVVWAGFVYGAAVYWLYLAILFCKPLQQPAKSIPQTLLPLTSSFAAWQVPSSWAVSLDLTLRIVGSLYLLTLCYFAFRHFRQHRHLKWVLSFTSEPPAEIAETFRSLARELRAHRSRLVLLSGAVSPATFGWLRPIVLLPNACMEEDRLELKDILRHELHHVHRQDALWNELAVAARGLLFFHPAIWYAVGKMQCDRELACDLAVVARSPGRRAAYAECLVRFAQSNVVAEHGGWGMDFAASAHHLTVRVRSILASKSSPKWLRCLRLSSALALSAVFFGVAPSLAVLLSFTQSPVTNPGSTSLIQAHSVAVANIKRTGKRSRFFASSEKKYGLATSENRSSLADDQPAMGLQPDTRPVTLLPQTDSGPQLRRRGDPSSIGNKAVTPQTILLTDADAKGQSSKSGDRKQAVQQTATAALGIYQRLSAIDRH